MGYQTIPFPEKHGPRLRPRRLQHRTLAPESPICWSREIVLLSDGSPQKGPPRDMLWLSTKRLPLLNSGWILLASCDPPTPTHRLPRAPSPACPANTPAMRCRISSSSSLSLSRSCTGNKFNLCWLVGLWPCTSSRSKLQEWKSVCLLRDKGSHSWPSS